MNIKIFIDSDSDVRLSRRVYKDTQDNKMDLDLSIRLYLDYIKPSY
jgi:uridine kinase